MCMTYISQEKKILSEVTSKEIEQKLGINRTMVNRYAIDKTKTKEGYEFIDTKLRVATTEEKSRRRLEKGMG